jgi:hypothetical protein
MTATVKSWEQLFQVIRMLVSSAHRPRRSQSEPPVAPAALRGVVTT